jgi:hypothetical protein
VLHRPFESRLLQDRLQATSARLLRAAREKWVLRPCSEQAGGVFSEYLGSVEFYLWFSADEELAVGSLQGANRLPTNSANSRLSNLAHGCDIGRRLGIFIAEFCPVKRRARYTTLTAVSFTERWTQWIYAAPSFRAGSCGGRSVAIMLFMRNPPSVRVPYLVIVRPAIPVSKAATTAESDCPLHAIRHKWRGFANLRR